MREKILKISMKKLMQAFKILNLHFFIEKLCRLKILKMRISDIL